MKPRSAQRTSTSILKTSFAPSLRLRLRTPSVLIEIHSDKGKGTQRENLQLLKTYVLLSAYKENGAITPVQFEIKQYIDNDNRLYLAVAMTKREEDVVNATIQDKSQVSPRLLSPSTYSIAEFIEKINPKDENFFKYIPNSFLNEQQKLSKSIALAKEDRKYERKITTNKAASKPLNDEDPPVADNNEKHSQDELRATLEESIAHFIAQTSDSTFSAHITRLSRSSFSIPMRRQFRRTVL